MPKHDKGTLPHPRHHRSEGDDMAKKIQIRPLDKKETTGESGGNGGG
ncbi:hypothetical protein ACQYWQ_09615 [Streptomyces sp. P6-2-1]